MKSLTPFVVMFMLLSIIFLVVSHNLAVYFSIPSLILILVQLIINKQHKKEPAIFFNLIIVIIIMLVDIFIRK
jgi:hypothetical protein